MEGSRRPESADGCVDVQEVGEVQRSEVMDGLPNQCQPNLNGINGDVNKNNCIVRVYISP